MKYKVNSKRHHLKQCLSGFYTTEYRELTVQAKKNWWLQQQPPTAREEKSVLF